METNGQRIVVVGGPPGTGKTSVMMQVIKNLKQLKQRVAVAKIDCLDTEDDERYGSLDIPVVAGLSNDLCPDHFFAVNFGEIVDWSARKDAEVLIIETAGLCHRCAPGTEKTLCICVVDCLSSIKIPKKIGPILTTADIILLTKGDIVSQAEREVFWHKIREINKQALIFEANGLTGGGCEAIARIIADTEPLDTINGDVLRHSMPTAICSYCVGEKRIGNEYQQGIIEKMDFACERGPSKCSLV